MLIRVSCNCSINWKWGTKQHVKSCDLFSLPTWMNLLTQFKKMQKVPDYYGSISSLQSSILQDLDLTIPIEGLNV